MLLRFVLVLISDFGSFSGFDLYVASICTLGPPPLRIEALNLKSLTTNWGCCLVDALMGCSRLVVVIFYLFFCLLQRGLRS